ncbi:sterol desaturase family protein [Ferrovum sp.]|uniref:sterol desaturase family protein n=1 Tax=Ferrovum sp. TaxID=2609467 RepID=UPI002623BB6C|nr:sterol desaturase family protein [Ferrovum sp.]
MTWFETFMNGFTLTQAWLFEHCVNPLLPPLGLLAYQEEAFDATEFALVGMGEIALLILIFRPLEALFPAERWSGRRGVRVDILYTLLHRLGFIPLVMFVLMWPLTFKLDAWLRFHGFIPYALEDLIPPLENRPLPTFIAYLVIIDFFSYWLHRFQHRLEWWWALHGVHHSQQTMSYWSDDRTHLLDDVLTATFFSLLSLVIGVEPGQFILLMMIPRILQSLAHANIGWRFGPFERCLVSPHYHRYHHGIGTGSESGQSSCNFAVLFPIWDILFKTANFSKETPPTGIADQQEGRDYGSGFWAQQRLGCQRLWYALTLGKA